LAASRKGLSIPQGAARTLDRQIRVHPDRPLKPGAITLGRIMALVETACDLIAEGCPNVAADKLHRFCKADSLEGLSSVKQLADLGVPYAMLPRTPVVRASKRNGNCRRLNDNLQIGFLVFVLQIAASLPSRLGVLSPTRSSSDQPRVGERCIRQRESARMPINRLPAICLRRTLALLNSREKTNPGSSLWVKVETKSFHSGNFLAGP
jgi:hypothetical protein